MLHFMTLNSPAIPSSPLQVLLPFSVFYLGHHLSLAVLGSCKQPLSCRASTPQSLFLEGTISHRETNIPPFRPHSSRCPRHSVSGFRHVYYLVAEALSLDPPARPLFFPLVTRKESPSLSQYGFCSNLPWKWICSDRRQNQPMFGLGRRLFLPLVMSHVLSDRAPSPQ